MLILIGIALFAQTLIREEQRDELQGLLAKGNYLVSLIALHPVKDLRGDRSEFFIRTLSEYITSEGLVYCFIHEKKGNSLLTLAPRELKSQIPETIRTKSLYTMGLTYERLAPPAPSQ